MSKTPQDILNRAATEAVSAIELASAALWAIDCGSAETDALILPLMQDQPPSPVWDPVITKLVRTGKTKTLSELTNCHTLGPGIWRAAALALITLPPDYALRNNTRGHLLPQMAPIVAPRLIDPAVGAALLEIMLDGREFCLAQSTQKQWSAKFRTQVWSAGSSTTDMISILLASRPSIPLSEEQKTARHEMLKSILSEGTPDVIFSILDVALDGQARNLKGPAGQEMLELIVQTLSSRSRPTLTALQHYDFQQLALSAISDPHPEMFRAIWFSLLEEQDSATGAHLLTRAGLALNSSLLPADRMALSLIISDLVNSLSEEAVAAGVLTLQQSEDWDAWDQLVPFVPPQAYASTPPSVVPLSVCSNYKALIQNQAIAHALKDQTSTASASKTPRM